MLHSVVAQDTLVVHICIVSPLRHHQQLLHPRFELASERLLRQVGVRAYCGEAARSVPRWTSYEV